MSVWLWLQLEKWRGMFQRKMKTRWAPPHYFLLCHSELASLATFSPEQLGMRYNEEITHPRRTFALCFSPFFLCHFNTLVLDSGEEKNLNVVSSPGLLFQLLSVPLHTGNYRNQQHGLLTRIFLFWFWWSILYFTPITLIMTSVLCHEIWKRFCDVAPQNSQFSKCAL